MPRGGQRPILRDLAVADERRPADLRQRHLEFEVPRDAQRRGDLPRRLDLARVDLPVADGQRVQLVPVRRAIAPAV